LSACSIFQAVNLKLCIVPLLNACYCLNAILA
jgi:hypothetical protein